MSNHSSGQALSSEILFTVVFTPAQLKTGITAFPSSINNGFVNVTEISGIPRLHQVRKTADPVILFNV